ncbi:PilZ domain-containing protein [Sediminispirochaeta smaragdinae]|jgi:hypothetical protein|uniref:Type IV pilus assembly PilZ n=1 Tax=Sediminispirochaeta smaragdinae (strain DSM 11293 / JCM 15392 / SEBR 4228) TaxID=573413 RepID=E1R4G4_SEDSS|nr:PilZ domain-containing protein [Sediminispirochaeta smaragdinae]ADK81705.1 type IV pilus assembly PilZ [Sediminispirochaeta smaragdinae DSM 11293]
MALMTSQQINRFYQHYREIDVTFNKDVIRATGLLAKHIFLKFLGSQIPCIIFSASMTGAKVIANISSETFERLRQANNLVSLRLSFQESDKNDPLAFFVASKISGFNPYNKEHPTLNFVNLEFTQRPPDDLIGILGTLLEASVNSKKRKEERIQIDANSIRKLGLTSKAGQLRVESIPRPCIIRDLSFSGAKVVVSGVAKFLLGKECHLHLETVEQRAFNLPATIVRSEEVEGRKDLTAVAIQFLEEQTPIEYKVMLNDYMKARPVSSAMTKNQKEA